MLRKLFKVVLILMIVVAVALMAALALGIPQRWLIAFAAGKALKAPIELGEVRTLDAISIETLKTVSEDGAKPKVELDGLKLDYKLWPKDGRHFPKLTLEYLTLRSFAEKAPTPALPGTPPEEATTEIPRSSRRAQKAPSSNPDAFVPRDISIKNLGLAMERPGFGLDISGLSTDITLGDNGAKKVALTGRSLSGTLTMGNTGTPRTITGSVDIGADIADKKTSISPLKVHVPQIAEIEGHAFLNTQGDTKEAAIDLPILSLQDIDLPGMLPRNFSLRLKSLRGTDNRLKLSANLKERALIARGTHLDLAAEDLTVAQEGMMWFEGDAALKVTSGELNDLDLAGELRLNDNPPIALDIHGKPMNCAVRIGFEDWNREQTLALLPGAFRAVASRNTLFSGVQKLTMDATFQFPQLQASADLMFALNTPGDAPTTARLSFAGEGSVIKALFGEQIPLTLTAAYGAQKLSVTAAAARRKDPHAGFVLESVDAAAWAGFILGSPVPAVTAFNGTAEMNLRRKEQTLDGTVDWSACQAVSGPLAVTGFSVKGAFSHARPGGLAGNGTFAAELLTIAGIAMPSFSGHFSISSRGGLSLALKSAGPVPIAAGSVPAIEPGPHIVEVQNEAFFSVLPEQWDAVSFELRGDGPALAGTCVFTRGADAGTLLLRFPLQEG